MSSSSTTVSIQDLEMSADDMDASKGAEIYQEHGCLVVRGLMKPYLETLNRDIAQAVIESLELLDQAKQVPEGWVTPNGTLFLPAPKSFDRDKQIMVLAVSYYSSSAFLQSALEPRALDLVEAILGPNIELFLNGQCLYKEAVGGHPKNLHQDSAYFEHKFEGPCGMLSYAVDTDLVNGALHVVPGSHRYGSLQHVDTFSHLGLNSDEWPWERAMPITGEAGDSIFFHVKTIHGSKENNSPSPRPVFINRYRAAEDYVVISGTTTENRAENEKRAEQAKKENQRGLMVRGFRAFHATQS